MADTSAKTSEVCKGPKKGILLIQLHSTLSILGALAALASLPEKSGAPKRALCLFNFIAH